MAEQKTIKGVLKEVDIKEGAKDGKAWKRATLKIDVDGDQIIMGTFNAEDIALANKLKLNNVEAVFVTNGQYQNLVKGGLKESDEIPVETIEEQSTKTPESVKRVGDYQATDRKRQEMIVRQNSYTQANAYMSNLLKAVELGIIGKEEFGKEELNLDSLKAFARKIEEDVCR